MPNSTYEQSVIWLREQPDQQQFVRDCYFDDPLLRAAQRFTNSAEWQSVRRLLSKTPGKAIDLGAGRGISSYALTREGWQVTAVEPDPSSLVGAGAIRRLAKVSGMEISVVNGYGEALPFDDNSFDLAYGRQVLHHARDLPLFCKQVARVLKPGGKFIATREHVISRREDLPVFLSKHPLHKFNNGENAFLLDEYLSALSGTLRVLKTFGSFDSPINFFPMPLSEWKRSCTEPFSRRLGRTLTTILVNDHLPLGQWLIQWEAARLSRSHDLPGRLYSFVAVKKE